MINIMTPQRFYEIRFKERESNAHAVIDLKGITEITLFEDEMGKEILIQRESIVRPIRIDENRSATEEFSKIVTAWTTYKLATEK